MLPLDVLVEMLHVPAHVAAPILTQHPSNLVHRHPLRRGLAQPTIDKPSQPILLVAMPVASELPFRHPQNLASLKRRKLLALPAAQYIPKLLHPAVL
jgi:hypothetical protein